MKMKSKMGTKGGAMGGPRKFNKGKEVKGSEEFPDLNKDGKVTQADVLQGRGVAPESGSSEAKKSRLRYIPRKAGKKKPKKKPTKSMLMPGMTTAKVPASVMEKPTGQTFKKGGMMKSKGYAKGGAMKTKGYAKGGVAGGKKKQKVRGAGIARRGVRPAKIR